jgi:hypothetical protein
VSLVENILVRLYFTKYQTVLGAQQKDLYTKIISKGILDKLNINTESNKTPVDQRKI